MCWELSLCVCSGFCIKKLAGEFFFGILKLKVLPKDSSQNLSLVLNI